MGRLTPHYAFLLERHLAVIKALDTHIATLDARIDEAMRPFAKAAALPRTSGVTPAAPRRRISWLRRVST